MADSSSSVGAGNSPKNKRQKEGKHSRSKSAMVSSLLSVGSSSKPSAGSRTHSRSNSAAPSATSSQHQLNNPTATTASTSTVNIKSTSGASTISSTLPPAMVDGNESGGSSLAGSGSGGGGTAKTVEETVRTFRLYEALRSGDTTAILKAIRDNTVDDPNRRTSMSSLSGSGGADVNRSSILHLAVQCAELPVIEYILSTTTSHPEDSSSPLHKPYLDINGRDLTNGNTPLHIAAQLGRAEVVTLLLRQPDINDSVHNYANRTPVEVARNPQVHQMLQLARSMYLEDKIDTLHNLVNSQQYEQLQELLDNPRARGLLDLNTIEPPDAHGSTLLHEAAKKKDTKLIQLLLMHGADPFRRDHKGKLPQDVTKDEKTRGILKKSPAAVAAARGIEERAVLGSAAEHAPPGHQGGAGGEGTLGSKETREMKGYLKKWTNYTGGYKLRWFVLEDGVLSYYKNQEDIGSACRGAINMRIAKLHIDPQDKQRFEIHGKGSVKYHLKANHIVEAKRWYWTLNNAIQQAKDEARLEERRKHQENEVMGRLREQVQAEESAAESDAVSGAERGRQGNIATSENFLAVNKRTSVKPRASVRASVYGGGSDNYQSDAGPYPPRPYSIHTDGDLGDDEEDANDTNDDSSSYGPADPPTTDALSLAAHSARLQLDLLSQVALALQFEHANNPDLKLGESSCIAAMASYESAVGSLKQLIGDLLSMSRDRDAYWRYRMEKEVSLRRLWEENMTKLAEEQEALEGQVVGERERRKKTKRALKRVLRKDSGGATRPSGGTVVHGLEEGGVESLDEKLKRLELDRQGSAKRDGESFEDALSESDESDQFFDAIDSGEVEVFSEMPSNVPAGDDGDKQEEEGVEKIEDIDGDPRKMKLVAIKKSYFGYEDPPRQKLSMDADDRPKISLWGILKSMIGKDMTKMTLPVSFNEPTSLLQRVAEDMEYTDLLDHAADRPDAAERMVYVAAFAASEYSSTISRVAKPFNPLLGETFEYCRPDKNFRFFVEQVSHHPPIGAAYGESEKWDYWGESAVKSKFYGKSFDINPLGTWFLRLRPITGGEELYTWKKINTSVVGIITGSPTIDNYGLMEITNWTTGVKCLLDFKQRGWRAANAYEVKGRVIDGDGTQMWSVGGRWNDKLYARHSPGFDATISPPPTNTSASTTVARAAIPNAAFLIWENHPRPPLPFSLTPFAITLNALPNSLRPHLCPTDTRLRPDQRAMEEGEYDFAATEKHRLEEKQRAKRRENEEHGAVHEPRWFAKKTCEITGEEHWEFTGEYWEMRHNVSMNKGGWENVQDIF